jgi:hypothetical protein
MKMQRISILVMMISFLFSNCDKKEDPPPATVQNFPIVYEGTGIIYWLSYVRTPQSQVFDSIVRINDGSFRLYGLMQEYNIEHIQLYKGTNKIDLSSYTFNEAKYPNGDSAFYAESHLSDMDFRNGRIVTADSILAEYYNTMGWNASQRTYFPDSGIFVIKILP